MKPNPDRDRNLLFGVFAVQLRKVTPSQIMEAAGAWATDPSKDLPTRLSEQCAINSADRQFLDRMVDEAIRAHDGDVTRTLQALGGPDMVADSFHRSIVVDSDGLVILAQMGLNLLEIEDPIQLKGVDEAPGRYTCESEHARGGMGRVLLVHDEYLGREIALKELLPGPGGASPTPVREAAPLIARFLQEAQITGQLEHPSIVPVYELGHRLDGSLYYTMKLVRGRTLRKALAEAKGLEDRLRLLPHFVDLCQAIAYAHSRHVIHRDIKPSNIMVGEFGETVVLDWGLAKVVGHEDIHADALVTTLHALHLGDSDSLAKTQYGQALGTPMYMPPEQAKGQIDQVDERSDVYSLGAVLYELLTGAPPFDGKTLKEILQRVIEDEPCAIGGLSAKAPPELAAIATRALNKDPKHRYQTAKELAEDTERFRAGALVNAYKYTVADKLSRFARKRRDLLTSMAAILIIVALGAVAYGVQMTRANVLLARARDDERGQRIVARKAASAASEARASAERENYFSTIQLAEKAISEYKYGEVRKLLASCPPPYRQLEWGYLEWLCNQDLYTFANHKSSITAIDIDATGSWVASADRSGVVRVWEYKTGREDFTLSAHADVVTAIQFSPDGSLLATGSHDMTVKLWDKDSGALVAELKGHLRGVNGLAFNPDGKKLLSVGDDDRAILWDVASHEIIGKWDHHINDVTSVAWAPDGTSFATGSRDDSIVVCDAEGKILHHLIGHENDVNALVWSAPDTLISADADGTIILWNVKTEQPLRHINASFPVSTLAVDRAGNCIAAAGSAPLIEIWDRNSEFSDAAMRISGHDSAIPIVRFTKMQTVLTGGIDGKVKIWAAPPMRTMPLHERVASIHTVTAMSPTFDRAAVIFSDGRLRVFDGREQQTKIKSESEQFAVPRFSADGRFLACANANRVRVWDVNSGIIYMEVPIDNRIADYDFSPDSRLLAVASALAKTSSMDIYDLALRQRTKSFEAEPSYQSPVIRFGPQSTLLGLGQVIGDRSRVTMHQLASDVPAVRVDYPGILGAITFNHAQTLLAISGDKGIRLYAVATGDEKASIDTGAGPAVAACFSDDDERLVWSGLARVGICENNTGREILRHRYTAGPEFTGPASGADLRNRALQINHGAWLQERTVDYMEWFPWSEPEMHGDSVEEIDAVIQAFKTARGSLNQGKRYRWTLMSMSMDSELGISKFIGEKAAEGFTGLRDWSEAQVIDIPLPSGQFVFLLGSSVNFFKDWRDLQGRQGLSSRSMISAGMMISTQGDNGRIWQTLGFQSGDEVLRINGVGLTNHDSGIETLKRAQQARSDSIVVDFIREGKLMTYRYLKQVPKN